MYHSPAWAVNPPSMGIIVPGTQCDSSAMCHDRTARLMLSWVPRCLMENSTLISRLHCARDQRAGAFPSCQYSPFRSSLTKENLSSSCRSPSASPARSRPASVFPLTFNLNGPQGLPGNSLSTPLPVRSSAPTTKLPVPNRHRQLHKSALVQRYQKHEERGGKGALSGASGSASLYDPVWWPAGGLQRSRGTVLAPRKRCP